MKIPFKWEEIDNRDCGSVNSCTNRAKVFGGWVVQSFFGHLPSGVATETSVFVPDPEWEI